MRYIMKKVYAALAALAFLLLYGTIGSAEVGQITSGQALVQGAIFLILFIITSKRAGLFRQAPSSISRQQIEKATTGFVSSDDGKR